jgi:cyclopropane fatty-acyl-phospholipid synthase-like methyltransferase
VEIALAKRALEKSNNGRILEIGNVLTHYLPHQHDVLDKYEKGEGVIHQDVVDFRPAAPYDLIVSISTIEHVGYDEEPQDPQKIAKAVSVLRSCLAPGGQLLVTIPVGYNPHADVLLRQGLFPRQYYLRRMGRKNTWVQTTKEDAFRAKFNEPYVFGNALVIGMADSPRRS